MTPAGQTVLAENPHIKFFNGQRGYVRCALNRETWRTDYRVVPYVKRPGAPGTTRASFVVEARQPRPAVGLIARRLTMIRKIASTILLVACAFAGTTLAARAVVADDSPPRDLAVYLEAEGMLPALESFAGPETGSPEQAIARRQANCCGVLWSSNAQVLFENHTANNRMTLRFEVPEDGSYAIVAVVTRAPDFGVYEFALDGRPVGVRFGAYSPSVARSDPLYLGRLELAEGSHTLTLAAPDKNPASSNYSAGLDYLELRGGGL